MYLNASEDWNRRVETRPPVRRKSASQTRALVVAAALLAAAAVAILGLIEYPTKNGDLNVSLPVRIVVVANYRLQQIQLWGE
jgi:hypothetical protein